MDTVGTSLSLSLAGPIQVFSAIPTSSSIVSISKSKEVRTEVKPKTSLKLILIGKTIDEDIDLDKEIVIPKIDLDTTIVDEMRLLSKLLEKKARHKQLRNEIDT